MSSTQGCSDSDRGGRRREGASRRQGDERKNELIESQFPSSLPVPNWSQKKIFETSTGGGGGFETRPERKIIGSEQVIFIVIVMRLGLVK
jgi:hypothetical protein